MRVTEEKKIKILTISDHPLSPSGVGTQTKYILEKLDYFLYRNYIKKS